MRVNPNRRPATQAEVNKAFRDGAKEGASLAVAMMLWSLIDGEFVTELQLKLIDEKFIKTSEAVKEGYIKRQDLVDTLREEYGIDV